MLKLYWKVVTFINLVTPKNKVIYFRLYDGLQHTFHFGASLDVNFLSTGFTFTYARRYGDRHLTPEFEVRKWG